VYVPSQFAFDSRELVRWQSDEVDGLRITAVPVQHIGWRYVEDRNWMNTSFTGYLIEYHGLKVYFGGDTAYHPEFFKETGQRFPGIDLVLMPIAPVEPREFMKRTHVDPGEALQAFVDLKARRMVPVHFDTFINSFDSVGAAGAKLEEERVRRGLSKDQVQRLEIGEQRVLIRK